MSYQNNKTDEQKFEDYLEDEYRKAVNDSDEYFEAFKAKKKLEEKKKLDAYDIGAGIVMFLVGIVTVFTLIVMAFR